MKFVVSSSVLLKQLSAINGVVSTDPVSDNLKKLSYGLDADTVTFDSADSDVLFYNGGSATKVEVTAVVVSDDSTPVIEATPTNELRHVEEGVSTTNEAPYRHQATKHPEHPLSFTPYQLDQLRQVLKPIVSEIVHHSLNPRPNLPERFLSGVSQVSEYFGIPQGTIRKHIKDIKHSKRGKRLYFTVQDVSDWIDQGRRATRDEVEIATRSHLNTLRRQ